VACIIDLSPSDPKLYQTDVIAYNSASFLRHFQSQSSSLPESFAFCLALLSIPEIALLDVSSKLPVLVAGASVTTGTGARGGFKSGVGLLLTMLGDFMADAGGWIYDDLNEVFFAKNKNKIK